MENNEDEFIDYSLALSIQTGINKGWWKNVDGAWESFCNKHKWSSKQEEAEANQEYIRVWNKYKNKISKNGK